MKAWVNSKFDQILPMSTGLPALERLKYRYLVFYLIFADPLLLYLHVTYTCKRSLLISNFGKVLLLTMELAAPKCLKIFTFD